MKTQTQTVWLIAEVDTEADILAAALDSIRAGLVTNYVSLSDDDLQAADSELMFTDWQG
jgi:hypothetical protein